MTSGDLMGFLSDGEMQLVRNAFFTRELGILSREGRATGTIGAFLTFQRLHMTRRHAASSKVHLHSSFSFP